MALSEPQQVAKHPDALKIVRELIHDDLRAIEKLISEELGSRIPLIQTIAQHIVSSGGKRLRPTLVILSAKALGYHQGPEHHELAAIIELVHTATLCHDDVVDESSLRRGRQTANVIWGNQASVLVGDFLYSKAFQILTRRGNSPIMAALAKTTNIIAEGEVMQLLHQRNPDLTEAQYFETICCKTAKLFEVAAQTGAMIATQETAQIHAMTKYGLNLGMAFQIVDDLLDYTANAHEMGKNAGDDLAEGKTTLPLIHALQHANANEAQLIRDSIVTARLDHWPQILEIINRVGSIDYCFLKANEFIQQAKNALISIPNTNYRDALEQIIYFIIERNF